jgi:hypothetical protein
MGVRQPSRPRVAAVGRGGRGRRGGAARRHRAHRPAPDPAGAGAAAAAPRRPRAVRDLEGPTRARPGWRRRRGATSATTRRPACCWPRSARPTPTPVHDALEQKLAVSPGLVAYGVDDAGRFFGREREVDALANRLVRSPLVAVVGPSGVGKSSFVHAGLAASPARPVHAVLSLRPGRHPDGGAVRGHRRPHRPQPCPEADAVVRELTRARRGGQPRLRARGDRSARGAGDPEPPTAPSATRFAQLPWPAPPTARPRRCAIVGTLRDDFASVLESRSMGCAAGSRCSCWRRRRRRRCAAS